MGQRVESSRVTVFPDFSGSGQHFEYFRFSLIISWFLNRYESSNMKFGLVVFLRYLMGSNRVWIFGNCGRVGSNKHFAGSGSGKVTRGQLWSVVSICQLPVLSVAYWGFTSGSDKSVAIWLSTHQRSRTLPPHKSVDVAGTRVQTIDTLKTLEVTLDSRLTSQHHESTICESCFFSFSSLPPHPFRPHAGHGKISRSLSGWFPPWLCELTCVYAYAASSQARGVI